MRLPLNLCIDEGICIAANISQEGNYHLRRSKVSDTIKMFMLYKLEGTQNRRGGSCTLDP